MSLQPYHISSESTNRSKSCTLLRSLNVCHFKSVAATSLSSMESRSSSMSLSPYKISSKSNTRFKSCTTSDVYTSAILEWSTSSSTSSPPYKMSTSHLAAPPWRGMSDQSRASSVCFCSLMSCSAALGRETLCYCQRQGHSRTVGKTDTLQSFNTQFN
jgi:hypothetical protein